MSSLPAMAPTQHPPGVSNASRTPIGLVLILLAHAPLVFEHFREMWRFRPHYEFAPVVIAAVVWLTWQRRPAGPADETRWTRRMGYVVLGAGLVTLAVAVALFSPWLGSVSAIISIGGYLLLQYGRSALTQLSGPWLLLWIVVPPPFGLDGDLIRGLQRVTSAGASTLLESCGVMHHLAGNVFRIPDRELFVAEACSGIHSQLVLVACCLILAVMQRRNWIHTILLVLSAVFWSAAVNIVRVTTIVFVASRYGYDLSTGWQHEVLGYFLILVGFGMVLCTDLFLKSVFSPVRAHRRKLLHRIWNRILASTSQTAQQSRGDAVTIEQGEFGGKGIERLSRTLVLAFIPLGLLSAIALLAASEPPDVEFRLEQLGDPIEEDWLPETIAGWTRIEFSEVDRDHSSDEGEHSRTWRFRQGDQIALVSMDFPYQGWHPSTRCYTARGWLQDDYRVTQAPADSPDGDYAEADFSNPMGDSSYLFHSLFDGAGVPQTPHGPPITNLQRLKGKLAYNPLVQLVSGKERSTTRSATTLQTQLFIASSFPLSEEEHERARELFLACRSQLRNRWLQAPGGQP